MSVAAIVGSPGNRTDQRQRGTPTTFTFRGSATNTLQLYNASASERIVIDYIYLQALDGGTWSLNVGDDSDGQIVRIEGDYDASGAGTQAHTDVFISDRFVWLGGGSDTDSENDINLTADGSGLCHYIVAGTVFAA